MYGLSGFLAPMARTVLLAALLCASGARAAEKPLLRYQPPAGGPEDRPVIVEVVYAPQGTDYAFKLEFNKEPWGDACRTRCANATLFLDTDHDKTSGLQLPDTAAAERGADLAIVVQGVREYQETGARSRLKVKVIRYGEDATTVESGTTLTELDPVMDAERVLAEGTSVYLLIDASSGDLPSGTKARLIYHPPDSPPLVGVGKGLAVKGGRVELFKNGKLTNPPKKSKSAYEKL